jgi:hypothetical protein
MSNHLVPESRSGALRKVVNFFFFPIAGPTNYLTPGHGIAARYPLGARAHKRGAFDSTYHKCRLGLICKSDAPKYAALHVSTQGTNINLVRSSSHGFACRRED